MISKIIMHLRERNKNLLLMCVPKKQLRTVRIGPCGSHLFSITVQEMPTFFILYAAYAPDRSPL